MNAENWAELSQNDHGISSRRTGCMGRLEAGQIFSAGPGDLVTGHLGFRNLLLKPGIYPLTLGLFSTNLGIDRVPDAARIEISDVSYSQKHLNFSQVTVGMIQIPEPDWQITKL